ncbi:MAG TPA: NUDIX hydrolase [Actinocrinis sp.]|nr:NUDIX hydrolase [Actinocrinis sp.]
MPISTREIRTTIEDYLLRHPEETGRLEPVTSLLAQAQEPVSRLTLPGHVTVNAILLNAADQVLHIKHVALGRWLTPGGHCEPEDSSLAGAALRELAEETGIPAEAVEPLAGFAGRPIDIDVHAIPANEKNGEPEHWHYDFRFVFRAKAGTDVGQLQAEEVTDSAWFALADTASPDVVRKLGPLV